MAGKATTVDQQIELLRSRGMDIEDEVKAKEILLDVGYYRLEKGTLTGKGTRLAVPALAVFA